MSNTNRAIGVDDNAETVGCKNRKRKAWAGGEKGIGLPSLPRSVSLDHPVAVHLTNGCPAGGDPQVH
jgi:hypothetical protein